jgi:hypothetical protein
VSASSFISIILGLAAGLWISFRNRRAEAETRYLAITPSPQTSFASKFYIIPPSQWPELNPHTLAALWYCRGIPPESMPDIASNLLERGLDGKWLRRCAGEMKPVRADIDEYVDALFLELGAQAPLSEDQAREAVASFLMDEISEGRINAFDGAGRVAALYEWDVPSDSKLSPLIALAYEDEYESPEKEAEIRQKILAFCSAFNAAGRSQYSPLQ